MIDRRKCSTEAKEILLNFDLQQQHADTDFFRQTFNKKKCQIDCGKNYQSVIKPQTKIFNKKTFRVNCTEQSQPYHPAFAQYKIKALKMRQKNVNMINMPKITLGNLSSKYHKTIQPQTTKPSKSTERVKIVIENNPKLRLSQHRKGRTLKELY